MEGISVLNRNENYFFQKYMMNEFGRNNCENFSKDMSMGIGMSSSCFLKRNIR